ncbi:hypothetical protein [Pseudarthrobacter sp. N5]|uniref:hypothetical protein n=1 Tax=Pseudarthrobacter sp. N5 TaxID=3418416 RepID=UPI003CF51079
MKRSELARHNAELGFTPQDAVRWLAPAQLARTAVKVLLATIFADFGDKRELEGSFPGHALDLDRLTDPGQPAQPVARDLGPPGPDGADDGPAARKGAGKELWLDFTADLGDGFDPSYTVALLLAEASLGVDGHTLPRGTLLVLGGDEVYPVASPAGYEDRMAGPYRKALPGPPGGGHTAVMLALPGNHDWYDGLTSFIRLFTRQRNIGGWRTIQTRSYFAVRLSGGPGSPGWWLVGLDSQLGQYIDEPQLDYFYNNITSQLIPGDAIILCVASPYWVKTAENTAAFKQMHFFEQDYLRRRYNREAGAFEDTGARVRLWLTGDQHHYSRFAEQPVPAPAASAPAGQDPRASQLITCGMGGAYLSDAQGLPAELTLPPAVTGSLPSIQSGGPGVRYVRMPGTYPDAAESRRLGARLANPFSGYWLPRRNPGFGTALGLAHVGLMLTLWTLFSALRGLSFVDSLRSLTHGSTVLLAVLIIAIPVLLLALLALLSAWFRDSPLAAGRGSVVAVRGVLYQLAALAVGTAVVLLIPWPAGWPHFLTAVLALALVFAAGFTAGSEAFAVYILATPGGEVASWRMSGQAIEEHKGFLRIRLAPDGTLTVHSVAVDHVCHDWDLEQTDDGGMRPAPQGGLPALRLFEPPIIISREGFRP